VRNGRLGSHERGIIFGAELTSAAPNGKENPEGHRCCRQTHENKNGSNGSSIVKEADNGTGYSGITSAS